MKRHRSGDIIDKNGDNINNKLSSLSLHALRVELGRRKLSLCGSRVQLQARLQEHLTELSSHSAHFRPLPTFITVPSTFDQYLQQQPDAGEYKKNDSSKSHILMKHRSHGNSNRDVHVDVDMVQPSESATAPACSLAAVTKAAEEAAMAMVTGAEQQDRHVEDQKNYHNQDQNQHNMCSNKKQRTTKNLSSRQVTTASDNKQQQQQQHRALSSTTASTVTTGPEDNTTIASANLEHEQLQKLQVSSSLTTPSIPSTIPVDLPAKKQEEQSTASATNNTNTNEMKHPDRHQTPETIPAPTTTTAPAASTPAAAAEVAATAKDATKPEKIKVIGTLQARSVWISGEESMRLFWELSGPIGKGNLSRSQPCYSAPAAERGKGGRAMRQLLEMSDNKNKNDGTNVHACEDEDDNDDHIHSTNYNRQNVEHLQLSLIEAYYAAFALETLTIVIRPPGASFTNSIIGHTNIESDDVSVKKLECPSKTWRLFGRRIGPTFAPLLVAYTRYRAAGWLPRSGLKYGVDWVLYPAPVPSSSKSKTPTGEGPKRFPKKAYRHTHAPYCVVLKFNNRNNARVLKNPTTTSALSQRRQQQVGLGISAHSYTQYGQLDRTWASLQNRLRLVKNVAKTLVAVDVSFDSTVCDDSMRSAFQNVKLTELTIDRWVP